MDAVDGNHRPLIATFVTYSRVKSHVKLQPRDRSRDHERADGLSSRAILSIQKGERHVPQPPTGKPDITAVVASYAGSMTTGSGPTAYAASGRPQTLSPTMRTNGGQPTDRPASPVFQFAAYSFPQRD
jgi:hypothetical protein